MMTDPIADMLTRIRNAQRARKETVLVPRSNMKARIAEILREEGYLISVEETQTGARQFLKLTLRYEGSRPGIQSLRRESTPGHRVYKNAGELPNVLNNYGVAIVSTSQGIMTNKAARKLGIGGEILCSVY